jgi:hypothetical protein
LSCQSCRVGRAVRTRLQKQLGGADRSRTGDLRLAKPALSQLSYGPRNGSLLRLGCGNADLVGQGRVELPTSRLSGVRSNHLSYWPSVAAKRLPRAGLLPEAATLSSRRDDPPEIDREPRSLETESYANLTEAP